jgi:hypothetical protein
MGSSGTEYIAVLVTVSTDGLCLPLLTIYKGAAVQAQWTSGEAYPGTLCTTSGYG